MSSVQSSISPLGAAAPTAVVLGVVLDRTEPLAYTGSPTQQLIAAGVFALAIGIPAILWAKRNHAALRRVLVVDLILALIAPALFIADRHVGTLYVLASGIVFALVVIAHARLEREVQPCIREGGSPMTPNATLNATADPVTFAYNSASPDLRRIDGDPVSSGERVLRSDVTETKSRFERALNGMGDSLYIALFGVHPRFDPAPHDSFEVAAFKERVRHSINDERVTDSGVPVLVRLLTDDYGFSDATARSWNTTLHNALDSDLTASTTERVTDSAMPAYFARTTWSMADRVIDWYVARRAS